MLDWIITRGILTSRSSDLFILSVVIIVEANQFADMTFDEIKSIYLISGE